MNRPQEIGMPELIQEALIKVMAIAYEITTTKDTDVFVRYAAHVNQLQVQIYPFGWTCDKFDKTKYFYINLGLKTNLYELDNLIKTLKTYL